MNKSVLITIIVILALVIGGSLVYSNHQKQAEATKMMQEQAAMKAKEDAAMKMKQENAMKKEVTSTPGVMMKDDKAGDKMMGK